MRLDSLIDALRCVLEQDLSLLGSLDPEQYRAPGLGQFKSSVGMHLRHNLDHFEAFFRGLEKGQIDYESRSRDTRLEDLPEAAVDAINEYLQMLEGLGSSGDQSLQVREESEAGVNESRWLASSVGRELQFLLGHTVHHNALIVMVVDGLGLELPEGFGVAPSTQRHKSASVPISR